MGGAADESVELEKESTDIRAILGDHKYHGFLVMAIHAILSTFN